MDLKGLLENGTAEHYLQLAVQHADCLVQHVLSNPTSIHLNKFQCEYLASFLYLSMQRAKEVLVTVTSVAPTKININRELFREFSWKVINITRLIFEYCSETWLTSAIWYAHTTENFLFYAYELHWYTSLFEAIVHQRPRHNGLWLQGISKIAGHERDELTLDTDHHSLMKTLQEQDRDGFRTKVEHALKGTTKGVSPANKTLAKTWSQKLMMISNLETLTMRDASCHPRNIRDASRHEAPVWTVDPKELKLGTKVGDKVYLSNWMGRTVAIKFFPHTDKITFEQESAIATSLKHPHVVQAVCTAIDKDGSGRLVMEKMDDSLHTFIERNLYSENIFLPLDVALDLMLQIAEGMRFLHERRVVHRDLKSSNVLVKHGSRTESFNLHLKVGDFGLSKLKERSSMTAQLTQNIGTSRWMAPELYSIKRDGLNINLIPLETLGFPFKVDVYSFALTCYEILAGQVPFYDIPSFNEMKRRVKEEHLRPELPESCPISLAALLVQCWDAEPSVRPTFDNICKELRHIKGQVLLGEQSFVLEPLSELYTTIFKGRHIPDTCPRFLANFIWNYQSLNYQRMDGDSMRTSNICNGLKSVEGLLVYSHHTLHNLKVTRGSMLPEHKIPTIARIEPVGIKGQWLPNYLRMIQLIYLQPLERSDHKIPELRLLGQDDTLCHLQAISEQIQCRHLGFGSVMRHESHYSSKGS